MTPTDEQIRTAIAQQAANWLVTNRSGSLRDEERRDFMRWLTTSPVHVHEYLRLAAIARDLTSALAEPQISIDSLAAQALAERTDNVSRLDPPRLARARSRRWLGVSASWLAAAGAALAATAAVAFLVLNAPRRNPSDLGSSYETAHGEQRAWRLPDGSQLRLDTDSALRIHFTPTERRAELLRGQAYFEVAHEAQRRFSVSVNGASIVSRGTQFDVYRQGEAALVTVVEGEVAVFGSGTRSLAASSGATGAAAELRANQQLRIESGILSKPVSADLDQALAWLRGKIAFERRPLGEVAMEFNRYAATPITILDAGVSKLPVSGIFDAHDTDSFIAFLRTLDGVSVERSSLGVYVRRTESAARGTHLTH